MTQTPRESMLQEASQIVSHDRNVEYGGPEQNFENIADLWLTRLIIRLRTRGLALTRLADTDPAAIVDVRVAGLILPHDVALYMSDVKDARMEQSPTKRDHYVDRAGYTACAYEAALSESQEER